MSVNPSSFQVTRSAAVSPAWSNVKRGGTRFGGAVLRIAAEPGQRTEHLGLDLEHGKPSMSQLGGLRTALAWAGNDREPVLRWLAGVTTIASPEEPRAGHETDQRPGGGLVGPDSRSGCMAHSHRGWFPASSPGALVRGGPGLVRRVHPGPQTGPRTGSNARDRETLIIRAERRGTSAGCGHAGRRHPLACGKPQEVRSKKGSLARNGRGRYYLPGTSMAGVVRAWLWDAFWDNRDQILAICGFQERDDGHASFLMVDDIELPPCVQRSDRDSRRRRDQPEAGNRPRGRPLQPGDRAPGPRVRPLKFAVEVPSDKDWPHVLGFFGHLLAALQHSEIRLGGARTMGDGDAYDSRESRRFFGRVSILVKRSWHWSRRTEGCGSPLSIAQIVGNTN